MSRLERPFEFVGEHSKLVIAVLLIATLIVGAGIAHLETDDRVQGYRGDSTEAAKLSTIESDFSSIRENATVARVVVRDGNVLDRETLIGTLELQRAIRENDTVAPTLTDERPTVGLANIVARAAARRAGHDADSVSIEVQTAVLESMTNAQVERVVTALLDDSGEGTPSPALRFVPNDYEPGSESTNATLVAVFQAQVGEVMRGQAPDRIVEAQTAIETLAAESDVGREAFAVGNGLVTAEIEQARQDSLSLVGPLALLLVLVVLLLAYRDLLDVALGMAGVALVLVWTFGAIGWLGIPFSSLYVAIPVLLIGLSIDYAIHVFMRYREERQTEAGEGETRDPRGGMTAALAAVGVALLWVTVTTAIGFLSNLASPVEPLQDIGVISALGIVSALVVFGGFVPALKIELDAILERVGFDRAKRPIGTAGGRFTRALSVGVGAARRSPVALLLIMLFVTAGATYGATQVSTSFEPQDFFPDDTPDWMEELPADLRPGEYTVADDLQYTSERFVGRSARAEILIEGDVTDPAVLERIREGVEAAKTKDTVQVLATGEPDVRSPPSVMARVAARHDGFAAMLSAADVDGDGLPDENLDEVYAGLFATAPDEASGVVHRDCGSVGTGGSVESPDSRTDCEYKSLRMTVAVEDGASSQTIRAEMRDVAGTIDGSGTTVTATGDPIVRSLVQDELLGTLLGGLAITLLAVLALLAVAYRLTYGSATLGVVTLAPVSLAVTWILATMALLDIPLSVLTALVASLTIGIGVDYTIHLTQRFVDERRRGKPPTVALADSVAGTGSALFGSAVTTASGFGVLSVAVLPTLQQFGIVTAITIVYAFVATVVVLPSLLVIWSRYVGLDTTEVHRPSAADAVSTADD